MRRNKRWKKPFQRKSPQKCFFCQKKIEPDYKKPEILEQFLSERKRILPHLVTGICAKHQRKLAREIKRSRHLALLPFVSTIH